MRACCQRNLLRAVGVHRLEALAATLEQNSHEIDKYLCIVGSRLDGSGVTQIGLNSMDLPHATQRL